MKMGLSLLVQGYPASRIDWQRCIGEKGGTSNGHQWWAAYAPALATVTAALMGGLLGSIIPMLVQQWKTKKAIKNVVCAQIKYTLRKAERFRDNKIEAAGFALTLEGV